MQNKVVGIVGAGRIGTAYARMMVEGHKCSLVYYDPYPNKFLEEYVRWVAGCWWLLPCVLVGGWWLVHCVVLWCGGWRGRVCVWGSVVGCQSHVR